MGMFKVLNMSREEPIRGLHEKGLLWPAAHHMPPQPKLAPAICEQGGEALGLRPRHADCQMGRQALLRNRGIPGGVEIFPQGIQRGGLAAGHRYFPALFGTRGAPLRRCCERDGSARNSFRNWWPSAAVITVCTSCSAFPGHPAQWEDSKRGNL